MSTLNHSKKSSTVRSRVCYHKNKDKWARNPEIRKRRILAVTRKRAKKKGCEFNLSVDDINIPCNCPVLNIPLEYGVGKPHDNSPSIDRIDPTKGYTKDNVRIISHKANGFKSNMTLEEAELILNDLKTIRQNS